MKGDDMSNMKVSLDGLMTGVEGSLRSSRDSMAAAYAYSLMEFAENLRLVKAGKATLDELFALYTLSPETSEPLTKRVKKERYACFASDDGEDDEDES